MSRVQRIARTVRMSATAILLATLISFTGLAQELILTDSITPDSINANAGQAAQEAADAWLGLIDSTNYEASWQQAAPMFQQQVSEAQWVQTLRSVHGPLGAFQSRAPQEREYRTAIPGAPEGAYVIVTYGSNYTQLASAVETVTLTKTDTGEWKVVGYYIRPAQ